MAVTTPRFVFYLASLHCAWCEASLGNERPTKIYGSQDTVEAFREWLRSSSTLTCGTQFMGAVVEVLEKMPDGWLFFVNHWKLGDPRLHKAVFVGRMGF